MLRRIQVWHPGAEKAVHSGLHQRKFALVIRLGREGYSRASHPIGVTLFAAFLLLLADPIHLLQGQQPNDIDGHKPTGGYPTITKWLAAPALLAAAMIPSLAGARIAAAGRHDCTVAGLPLIRRAHGLARRGRQRFRGDGHRSSPASISRRANDDGICVGLSR